MPSVWETVTKNFRQIDSYPPFHENSEDVLWETSSIDKKVKKSLWNPIEITPTDPADKVEFRLEQVWNYLAYDFG